MQAEPAAELAKLVNEQCPGAVPAASHATWSADCAEQVSNAVVVAHVLLLAVQVQPACAVQSVSVISTTAQAALCVGEQVLPADTSPTHMLSISPPPASQIAQSLVEEVPAPHVPADCGRKHAVRESRLLDRCGARAWAN